MYSKSYKNYKFYPIVWDDNRLNIGSEFICYLNENNTKLILTLCRDTEFSFLKNDGENFRLFIIAMDKRLCKSNIYNYFYTHNNKSDKIKLINTIDIKYNNYSKSMIKYEEKLVTLIELIGIMYHILPDELIIIIYYYLDTNNINCDLTMNSHYIDKTLNCLRLKKNKYYICNPSIEYNISWITKKLVKS